MDRIPVWKNYDKIFECFRDLVVMHSNFRRALIFPIEEAPSDTSYVISQPELASSMENINARSESSSA